MSDEMTNVAVAADATTTLSNILNRYAAEEQKRKEARDAEAARLAEEKRLTEIGHITYTWDKVPHERIDPTISTRELESILLAYYRCITKKGGQKRKFTRYRIEIPKHAGIELELSQNVTNEISKQEITYKWWVAVRDGFLNYDHFAAALKRSKG